FYLAGVFGMGNFLIFLIILLFFNRYILTGLINGFQKKFLPRLLTGYERMLNNLITKWRAIWLVIGTVVLFVFSLFFFAGSKSQVVFFPQGDPNYVYVYIKLPVGTSTDYTDSITRIVENRVYKIVQPDGKPNPMVDAIIANVAVGATDPNNMDQSVSPNK